MIKSKSLLFAAILGSADLIYLGYRLSGSSSGLRGTAEWGALLAAVLAAPQLTVLAFAVLLNWISCILHDRWAALAGGIAYGAAAYFSACMLLEFPSILFSFVGFFTLKKDTLQERDLLRVKYCLYCGVKRDEWADFTSYGFCRDCHDQVKSEVMSLKKELQHLAHRAVLAVTEDEKQRILAETRSCCDQLAIYKRQVPAFKSDYREIRDHIFDLIGSSAGELVFDQILLDAPSDMAVKSKIKDLFIQLQHTKIGR